MIGVGNRYRPMMWRSLPPFIAVLAASWAQAQWQPVDTTADVTALFSAGDTLIWGTSNGLVRWSDDQGQTWGDISGSLPPGYVDNIGKGAGERLFCTVGSLVYRADELGAWEGAASLGGGATCMAIDDSLILVGAEFSGGLQRSQDNGMSWAYVGAPMVNCYMTSVATDGHTIWASRFGDDAMVSMDSGSTWVPIPGLEGINVFCLYRSEGLYAGDDINIHCPGTPWVTHQVDAQTLDMDRSSGYLAACGTFPGVFVSSDYCASWQPIEAGYTTFQINQIAFIGTVIYAGNYDGLWKLDLDTWSGIRKSLVAEQVRLWPNPVRQEFSFSLPETVHGPVDIDLLDMSGRIVASRRSMTTTGSMSVGDCAPGRYMARFRAATATITSGLVIVQ